MTAQQVIHANNKADDIENRLRHNNVRIVGLPGEVEDRDPTTFVERWLQEIFGKEAFTPLFAVERAHRTHPRPHPPGNPPCSMLAKTSEF